MADNSVDIVVSLDDRQAQQELNRLTRKIESLRAQIQSAEEARMPLVEQARELGAQLDIAKEKLYEMQNAAPGTYSADEIARQKENVAVLQSQWDSITKQVERYDSQIARATANLEQNESRAGELSAQLAGVREETDTVRQSSEAAGNAGAAAADKASSAVAGIGLRLEKLTHRILGLVRRVFFFSLITKALRGVREYISNAMKSSNEFASALAQLKGALATAFQPILSAIIPALTVLINVLTRVVSLIASVISLLFGTTIKSSAAAAKGLNEESDAIKGVGGAAAKAEKQLASFDEINQLNDNSGGGGGGGGDTPSIDWDFPTLEDSKVFLKIKELIDSLDFSKLLASWDRLKRSASDLWDTLSRGFGWVWDNILVPLAQWTINELAPRLLELLAAAFDFLRAVLEALAPVFEPFWEDFLKPFFEFLGDLTITVLEDLIDLLKDLTALINGDISFMEFIDGLNGIQLAILALCGAEVLAGLTRFGKRLVATCSAGVKSMGPLATAALGAFDAIMLMYDAQKLSEAADAYNQAQEAHNHETEVALSSYAKLYDDKGKEAADSWAWMVYQIDTTNMSFDEAQAALAKKVDSYWDGVPQNMWEGFKAGWDDYFGEDGKGLWQLLKDAFQNVLNWLREFLGINSPSTVFYDIGDNIVQGLWNGFKDKWDGFVQQIQTWWNGLKTWWDGLSLKTITGNVATTGNYDNLYVPRSHGAVAPHLAEGSVIPPNREFLAVLGDQKSGTNIEAPLDTIVQAFRMAMSENGGSREIPEFKIYLDSKEIRAGQMRLNRAMGV